MCCLLSAFPISIFTMWNITQLCTSIFLFGLLLFSSKNCVIYIRAPTDNRGRAQNAKASYLGGVLSPTGSFHIHFHSRNLYDTGWVDAPATIHSVWHTFCYVRWLAYKTRRTLRAFSDVILGYNSRALSKGLLN